jgi:hypothetical protein
MQAGFAGAYRSGSKEEEIKEEVSIHAQQCASVQAWM